MGFIPIRRRSGARIRAIRDYGKWLHGRTSTSHVRSCACVTARRMAVRDSAFLINLLSDFTVSTDVKNTTRAAPVHRITVYRMGRFIRRRSFIIPSRRRRPPTPPPPQIVVVFFSLFVVLFRQISRT